MFKDYGKYRLFAANFVRSEPGESQFALWTVRSNDPHETIDMPAWGQQFSYLRSGSNSFVREAYARGWIHALASHIESLQFDQVAEISSVD